MTTIRRFPLLLLPPVLAAGALALVNFLFRRRKSRAAENLDIVY
ncbi:hypothetical protein [Chlorobium sp.]|nr:hypothetical protein [Chlorobium sp.]